MHYTGIAEVRVRISLKPEFFSGFNHSCFIYFSAVQIYELSYIHLYLAQCIELIWTDLTRLLASERYNIRGQKPSEGRWALHNQKYLSAVNRRDSRTKQKWAAAKVCLWFYSARLWRTKMPVSDPTRSRPHNISANFLARRTQNRSIHRNVW